MPGVTKSLLCSVLVNRNRTAESVRQGILGAGSLSKHPLKMPVECLADQESVVRMKLPDSPKKYQVAVIRFYAVVVAGLLFARWIALIVAWDDPLVLDRDWTAFHRAGLLFWEGRLRDIYPLSFETVPRFPFLYPPFAIYAFAPLGLLSPVWAYATCAAVACLALALALRWMRNLMPDWPADYLTSTLVVLASVCWLNVVVTGQLSALLLLIIVGGFVALRRGQGILAGVVFALLLIKPNLGAVFALYCLASRNRRVLLGLAMGGALLGGVTLFLGVELWQDFFAASQRMAKALADGRVPMWKQQTVYAFWRTTLGSAAPPLVIYGLWAGCVLPAAIGVWSAWRARVSAEQLPRILAITVLLAVACNPYMYIYDGLLLVIPGLVWHAGRHQYASVTCRRICGFGLAGVFFWQHVSYFVFGGGPAIAGAAAWVWLMAEVCDSALARLRDVLLHDDYDSSGVDKQPVPASGR